ncbi:C40 family peptidase [Oceanobacillus damuensis]|uniref:C40 family peptidase n=1 Tax=Oceanobacillus damuensis TaxID=937928 RepID=UPI0008300499|nr:C40 family peptidase [Oceanobacillus damuensis]
MPKQTFDQYPEEIWVTAVQVATVWTNPESVREMDVDGTANPTNIDNWVESLSYEASLALCNENRVQSQILYGEPVLVTEVKDNWAHVIIPSQPSSKDERGYPGWVPVNQLAQVPKDEWFTSQTAAVIKDKAWLEAEDGAKVMKLSYMTLLPVKGIEAYRVKVATPHGDKFLPEEAVHIFSSKEGMDKGCGLDIVKAGEAYIGLGYFWGGMSSFGYDCSGLAYTAHKANGYQIARDAGDQAAAGEKVEFDQLQPGDLLFFAYEEGKGRLHHVGIYYGDGKMLHSPQTGKGIEIISLAGTKYEKELCAARRYWQTAKEKRNGR